MYVTFDRLEIYCLHYFFQVHKYVTNDCHCTYTSINYTERASCSVIAEKKDGKVKMQMVLK